MIKHIIQKECIFGSIAYSGEKVVSFAYYFHVH